MSKYIHQEVTCESLGKDRDNLLAMTEKKYYKTFTDVICLNDNIKKKNKYDIFKHLLELRVLSQSYYVEMLQMFATFQISEEILQTLVETCSLIDNVYKIFSKNQRYLTMDSFLWDRETFVVEIKKSLSNDQLSNEQAMKLYHLYRIRESLQYLQYIIYCCPENMLSIIKEIE